MSKADVTESIKLDPGLNWTECFFVGIRSSAPQHGQGLTPTSPRPVSHYPRRERFTWTRCKCLSHSQWQVP